MKTHILYAVIVTAVALASGCSTVGPTYVPQTLGPVTTGVADAGLSISIDPASYKVVRGDPVVFEVTYRNVGTTSFHLPRDPDVLFVWTYADGQRDNYLMDIPQDRYYRDHELIELTPGDEYVSSFPVKTYYFDCFGITEFRAILNGVPNANPELKTVWTGRSISNGYGIHISKNRRDLAFVPDVEPLAQVAR